MADSASITFDLDPGSTSQGASQTTAIIGPHDAPWDNASGDDLSGLSDDQINTINAWTQENQAAMSVYTQSIQSEVDQGIQAWQQEWATPQNMKLLNEAQNVRHTLSFISDANGDLLPNLDAPVQTNDGATIYYGPTQEYWFVWDAPFGVALMPADPVYFMLYSPGTGSAQVFKNSPPTLAEGQTLANGGQPMTYQAFYNWAESYILTDAVEQQQSDYNKIFSSLPAPPKPTPLSTGGGDDITEFEYSAITISGTSWEYDQ